MHYEIALQNGGTKKFNCVPCEAHGQTDKKNWYRSRQRAPWTDSDGAMRRGYTTVLEIDNMFINATALGLI